jgi:DNA-binding transcriptional MerR regulator
MKKNNLPEKKQFFTIGEVSNYLDIPESTLRYWEKEFPQIKPQRFGGERRYSRKDIEQLEIIYMLLKVQKLTIKGAKDYLKKRKKNFILRDFELVQDLKHLKKSLEKLKKLLEENA